MSLFTDIEVAERFVIYSAVGAISGIYLAMLWVYGKKFISWIRKKYAARKNKNVETTEVNKNTDK